MSNFYQTTSSVFNKDEIWVDSSGYSVSIYLVYKYDEYSDSEHISDFCVVYKTKDGYMYQTDAWNFQVRYTHISDV